MSAAAPVSALDRGTPADPLDLLCVGAGPFGLGLAALADPLEDLRTAFLDRRERFDWHPGMLFEDATLQVPFLADLVTMADPTSPHSYLCWLKETGRLYEFYVRESFYPLRQDYAAYCRWVSERVRGLRWAREVVEVRRPSGRGPWEVVSDGPNGRESWWSRHLVVGAGTIPHLPHEIQGAGQAVVHTADYLPARQRLISLPHVTVLGSGQSAAEAVIDLLEAPDGPAVDWITRSARFYPMEYAQLSLELTSPEYLDHFRSLPGPQRDALNASQPQLHRGISEETITRLYELLHIRRSCGDRAPVRLQAATALTGAQPCRGRTLLRWESTESGARRETLTDAVVAGTGYRPADLDWLAPVRGQLTWDDAGRLTPDRWHRASPDGTVHVLNHTEHTHALTAPDLGMGPIRAAVILGHVAGREAYPVERRTMFQSFGSLPQNDWGPARDDTPRFTTSVDGRTFTLRPVRPEDDADLLHTWLSQPRAAAWGLQDATAAQIRTAFDDIAAAADTEAWMMLEEVDGLQVPRGFAETYDPVRSPLAAVHPVRDGDVGLHFFMAPAQPPVPGTSLAAMTAVLRLLLSWPSVERVVVEPDERRQDIRALNRRAGFHELGPVVLPDKTACLSVLERRRAH